MEEVPSTRWKSVDVNLDPFAAFSELKNASAMQKYIVPCSIAIHWLSIAKNMTVETVKDMLIAIIDAEQLMPSYPDCKEEAKKYWVAFGDFAERIKNAAGMQLYILLHNSIEHIIGLTLCLRPCRTLPAQAPQASHCWRLQGRQPEGVLRSILDSDDVPIEKPNLYFAANQHLSVLAKPGVTPVVWEEKGRLGMGSRNMKVLDNYSSIS